MKWLRYFKNREGGQALVEFSLVSIVFFLIVFGLVDVGRAVWNYNTLAHATREGTRYAIVHGANSSDPSGPGSSHYSPPNSDENVTETVQSFGQSLNPSRLTVEADWTDGTNNPGDSITITSEYTYEPMFNLFGMISFDMQSSSTMTISQ